MDAAIMQITDSRVYIAYLYHVTIFTPIYLSLNQIHLYNSSLALCSHLFLELWMKILELFFYWKSFKTLHICGHIVIKPAMTFHNTATL